MKNKMRLIIVGGVAGGASAAARARRLSETADIILLERGEYISFANCGLPYYIGGEIINRDSLLVQTPEKMMRRYNIDIRIRQEVIAIDRARREIVIRNLANQQEYRETYDKIILSPGAKPIRPAIPGIEDGSIFSLRNLPDMDAIVHNINSKEVKHATIVGAGYIGLEMAEALQHRNIQVSLIELADHVLGPIDVEMASLLHQELILNGIDLRLGLSVVSFERKPEYLNVILSNYEEITTDFVILAIDVKPEITLAESAGLKIGSLGGIEVNACLKTSDENIYAIGDAIEIKDFVKGESSLIPLAGPANRQGRIAAENIFGRKSTYKNTQGTGICKVFNQTVGMIGINEKVLKRRSISYQKIYLHAASHASYYPGAVPISLKLLFSNDGEILGAQAIGLDGVDKRIDVISAAMRAKQTVYDLEDEELCYSPPYGSAKDPINYAGFVASNVLKGDMPIIYAEDIESAENSMLLDVRTSEEFNAGAIPEAINMPLDELRHHLDKLPRDKTLIVFCRVGLRGYLACRILMQHGFKCRNLTGGYITYQMVKNQLTRQTLPKETQSDAGEMVEIEGDMIKKIDARGIQCPGPIQKLSEAINQLAEGDKLCILTTDPGFISDAPAWCETMGHRLIAQKSVAGYYQTVIEKSSQSTIFHSLQDKKKLTIIVFSGDFDRAMAAFIIANGAAAMGYNVTLFFTFWGLNILRKDATVKIKKRFIEKMFGKMMPRGPKKLALSKMNMLGMGPAMIKYIMKQKNIPSLSELIEQAAHSNVKLIACAMSMDLMGIKKEEMIKQVEQGGVAKYLNEAGQGNLNLFI